MKSRIFKGPYPNSSISLTLKTYSFVQTLHITPKLHAKKNKFKVLKY